MSDSGPGEREVAFRLFAHEFDDASLSYSESDEERAPNYVVTPTGARVNRLFVAGVLTEVETVNEDTRRGRIVDPTGPFVTYAGQYQPDEQAFLERSQPPTFVALTGKARTFQPEDSDRVFTSVRPESINEIDADTRDRWVVSAAEATLDRLAVFEAALDSDLRGEELRTALAAGGAPDRLAAGIPRALDHYRTSPAYLEAIRRMAIDALELVAGDRDDVRTPDHGPSEGGHADIGPLPDTDVTVDDAAVERTESTDRTEQADRAEQADPVAESDDAAEPDESIGAPETVADEPEVEDGEPEAESADPEVGGDLGDFDAGDLDATGEAETDAAGDADLDDPETADLYEMGDEEREQIESEYGTEFATGSEVDEPGEADIDVPDPEDAPEAQQEESEPADGTDTESSAALQERSDDPETAASAAGGSSGNGDEDSESEDSEASKRVDEDSEASDEEDSDASDEVDLSEAAVDVMSELDDGSGADREAVVGEVVDRHGADPEAVEDAIQDALMSGQCYEPDEGTLKAI